MKKCKKIAIGMLALAMAIILFGITDIYAKERKTKVSYTLSKKGTLTIKGKGEMPKKMTFKGNKKIKKVVIKKGVTSVSNSAFYNCKKLKTIIFPKTLKKIGYNAFGNTAIRKVTIPKSVKKIGTGAFTSCKKLEMVTMPGDFSVIRESGDYGEIKSYYILDTKNVNTITLNTSLKLRCVPYMIAKNINVSASDSKYKSIKGIIYSKDGTELVRVPNRKTEVVIANGCKIINTTAFTYGLYIGDGFESTYSQNQVITIPDTVEKVISNGYTCTGSYVSEYGNSLRKIFVNTQKLDEDSVWTLLTYFTRYGTYDTYSGKKLYIRPEDVLSQLDDYDFVDGMYISKDKTLMAYVANEKVVEIPEGVVRIAPLAFATEEYYFNVPTIDRVSKIIMPNSVKEIGDNAFANRGKLKELQLSNSLEKVGSSVIYKCPITKLEIPTGIKEMSEYAFAYSYVENIVISEGYTTMPAYCFWANSKLKTVMLPSTLKTLNVSTFGACDYIDVDELIKGTAIVKTNDY